MNPVIKDCVYCLIHVPDLVRYGSKPYREIQKNPDIELQIKKHLRFFCEAMCYPPNQVFIGNLAPEELDTISLPWYQNYFAPDSRPWCGQFGEVLNEAKFYSFLKVADSHQGDFIWLNPEFLERIGRNIFEDFFFSAILKNLISRTIKEIQENISAKHSLPLYFNSELIGCVNRDNSEDGREDENLSAHLMLENLAAKASGAAAVDFLLSRNRKNNIMTGDVDYIISCSEEAIGDRYNRGGGNLGKAIGEMVGLKNATGPDIKAFCSAPIYAVIHAAALVKSGICKNIVVVGGGSLAKLGMKFLHHLQRDMPILEDVLGCFAMLISEDDGESPIVRLDAVGKHNIGAGSSQQAIIESLIVEPLQRIGLKMTDVDKYASELHNPEITIPSRSGDVPLQNYRIIAAIAANRGEISQKQIPEFVLKRGMKGFAPTQGHVPAAVPYLGHAIKAIKEGKINNAMFLARASLFLGRLSHISDGVSFLLEKNPARKN